MKYVQCVFCKQPFSDTNVYSVLGWKETQISGMCETCFDDCCKSVCFEEDN